MVTSDSLLLEMMPSLYRLRIPGGGAHLLNCYIWLGRDGVTLIDTGWPDSAPVIEQALASLGKSRSEVTRIVLTHFHDDHAGSAAQIAGWSDVEVVAGVAEASFITGNQRGPLAQFTPKEQEIHAEPSEAPHGPPCRVDRQVADGDVLDFAGGATVISTPGHTPGSIAVYLPEAKAILTGDTVAEFNGQVILGVFNTNRAKIAHSLQKLANITAQIAGFGHGEVVLTQAQERIRTAIDPFSE